jgi:diguanylate cyclase (GGDEF)-like protein/PAS domain S-box-containing protein
MAVKVESRQAPIEAEDHRSRWEIALEGAGQGVWDHDLVKGTAYYSPSWYKMRGFEDGENVDAELGSWFERLHPDERDKIYRTTVLQNSGELPHNAFEYRERHRDGSWVWVLSRGRPVAWKADGTVARIVGTDTDITQLKAIERQLAEEKERLQVTLRSIADGMISTDADGKVTFVNAAAEQYTGWELAAAIGRPLVDVLSVADGERVPLSQAVMEACLGSLETVSMDDEVVLVSRSGSLLDIRLTASPVIGVDRSVLGAVLVFQDVTQSRAQKRALSHIATHDTLTGLPNRAVFNDALEAAAETARREQREHALCYIDLDHFKAVNDGAGHAAGDEVLIKVAGLLRRSCRTADFPCRIGGDEFILLLLDCSLESAEAICNRIVDLIGAQIFAFGGNDYRIGASIGITSITFRRPSALELTTEADAACYVAKSKGRGRVAVYPKDLEPGLLSDRRQETIILGENGNHG